jgi:hypothetical protein
MPAAAVAVFKVVMQVTTLERADQAAVETELH